MYRNLVLSFACGAAIAVSSTGCKPVEGKKGVGIEIGSNVTIGHGAILHSCNVGNNTLIGMGAIILDDSEVGNNCLVAAGSVVTKDVPAGALAVSRARQENKEGWSDRKRLSKPTTR